MTPLLDFALALRFALDCSALKMRDLRFTCTRSENGVR